MLPKRLTSNVRTHRLKVKGEKKMFYANGSQKIAGVAILLSNKTDFKTKSVRKEIDGHCIMIKGSIQKKK